MWLFYEIFANRNVSDQTDSKFFYAKLYITKNWIDGIPLGHL